jgi:hypothetical protein
MSVDSRLGQEGSCFPYTASEEPLRLTLSHIMVTFDGREATATFTFRALIPAGLQRPADPAPSTDAEGEGRQALPQGSLFSGAGLALHPGRAYALSLDPPLDDQCHDLHRSALLGNSRIERVRSTAETIQQGHPLLTWTTTTHAGSERERLDWGRDLIQRSMFYVA